MIKLFIFAGASFFQPQVKDSLGTETINGKLFVVHKVGEKETLYGISKRYGTTVDAIVQNNPTTSDGILDIGEVLKVPYGKSAPTSTSRTNTSSGGGLIHVVTAKETMFSISRAYGVSVDEIKQWNNLSDNAISIGQELTIRRRNTVSATTTTTATSSTVEIASDNSTSARNLHTVEAKETLFSIAAKYNISVQQIKDWNSLTGNELQVGQQLRVGQGQTETAQQGVSNTNETVKATETVKIENPTASQNTTPVPVQTTPKVTEGTTIRVSESRSGDEVLESGVAELIEGTDANRKYLALHRTAPVGTILKVKNEMNNREVFVRVMGKLPDNAMSDKVVIKISKSAYDRLGAIDPRFRVQVTYYK